MEPDTIECFIYRQGSKATWDKVNANFLEKEDDTRIFDLLIATMQTNHGF